MHPALPDHVADLVARLNDAIEQLHDAGHTVSVTVAHETAPADVRALPHVCVALHDDVTAEPAIPAAVAVLPVARPVSAARRSA